MAIKETCETRVRYGYRRVHVMLQREGWQHNVKKTYRIYKEMGLQLGKDVTEALERACSQIGYPKPSALTKDRSSSRTIWTYEPMPKDSRWTSHACKPTDKAVIKF